METKSVSCYRKSKGERRNREGLSMFKNIFKRDATNSPQAQRTTGAEVNGAVSPARGSGLPQNGSSPTDDAEGFLCPMCMKSFSNPDVLQHHFDSAHSSGNSQQVSAEKEVEMLKMQLTASEESRGLLSTELVSMQKQMQELALKNQTSDDVVTMNGEQIQKYEEKCELLEVERDMMAQRCQDAEKKAAELQEKIFQTEKSHQSAKDAVTSEKEKLSLISSQLAQEQQRNKQLLDESKRLSEALKQSEISIEQIKISSGKAEELAAKLTGKEELCRSLELQIQELRQSSVKHDSELEHLRKTAEAKEEAAVRTQAMHLETKSMLESKIHSMEALIQEKTSAFDRAQGELGQLTHKNSTLESKLLAQQDELAESNKKYDDLHNNFVQKVEDREGSNVLLTELKEEKARIQEKLKHADEKLATEREDNFQKLTAVENQNRELERKIVSLNEQISQEKEKSIEQGSVMSSTLQELKSNIETLTNEKAQLETVQMSKSAETEIALAELRDKLREKDNKVSLLENQCDDKNATCKTLETQLNEKSAEIRQLQTDLSTMTQQITDLQTEVASEKDENAAKLFDLQNSMQLAEDKLQDSQTNCSTLEADLDNTRSMYEAKAEELDQIDAASKRRIEDLEASEDLLKEKLSALDQLQEDYSTLNDQCTELSGKVNSLQSQLQKSQQDNQNLTSQLTEAGNKSNSSQQELEQVKAELSQSQERLGTTMTELDLLTSQLLEKEAELIAAKHKMDEIVSNSESLQKSLLEQIDVLDSGKKASETAQLEKVESLTVELTGAKQKLKKQAETTAALTEERQSFVADLDFKEKELIQCRDEITTVTSKLDNVKATLEKKLDDQNCVLQETSEILQRTSDENEALAHVNAELKMEIENLEEHLKNSQSTSDDWQSKHRTLEDDMNIVKEALSQERSNTEEAKQILISQKLQLQAQNDKLQSSCEELESKVKEAQVARDEAEEKAHDQVLDLQKALTAERSKFEDDEAKFNMQMVSLNENLLLNKNDLTATQEQLMDVVKHNDELRGLHVELEAKLEASIEDRRMLWDRCMTSENETLKLREEMEAIKQNLDQANAALHELGRENQTLQNHVHHRTAQIKDLEQFCSGLEGRIKTTKVQSRKWANDAEVVECANCTKAFSVTVRKHHCRSCGNIFCHECSSKQAALPASKKPVRVCDTCCVELNR